MKNKKVFCILLSLILCFLQTGCFDNIELENKSFVVALGVDICHDEDSENKFTLTMVIPDLSGKDEFKKTIKTAKGITVTDAIANANEYSANLLDFRHVSVIILSKEILSDSKLLRELMDVLERNKQLSNKTILMCCDGNASKVVSSDTKEKKIIGKYVTDFYNNNKNTMIVSYNKDLTSILQNMSEGQSVIIPKIEITKDDEVKLKDGMIVKNFSYVGEVDDELTKGYAWVYGEANGAVLTTDFENKEISSKISKSKSKIKFYEQDNQLYVYDNIEIVSNITEFSFNDKELLESGIISNIKKQYENQIADDCVKTWNYFCDDVNVDGFEIKEKLKKQNYNLYLKYAKDKDDFLKNTKFVSNVKLEINSIGSVK